MKVALKPVIEALSRDANQLEHRAQKLRIISPSLEIGRRVNRQEGGIHQTAGRDFGTVGIATSPMGPFSIPS